MRYCRVSGPSRLTTGKKAGDPPENGTTAAPDNARGRARPGPKARSDQGAEYLILTTMPSVLPSVRATGPRLSSRRPPRPPVGSVGGTASACRQGDGRLVERVARAFGGSSGVRRSYDGVPGRSGLACRDRLECRPFQLLTSIERSTTTTPTPRSVGIPKKPSLSRQTSPL